VVLFRQALLSTTIYGEKGSSVVICSICIATYKRTELLDRLLTSISEQVLPDDVNLEVIIVDNDCEGGAAPIVRRRQDERQISFQYFLQPVKNISLTRNMAVANASGDYLFFIDDDEVAMPAWVSTLLDAAAEHQADAVFGPVFPTFDHDAPEWIRKGAAVLLGTMSRTPEVVSGWTGNCLIRARILEGIPGPFDPEYGNTGGEDTELFSKLLRKGARFIYCGEARVHEYCPPERTRLSYLLKRGLKGGNSYTRRKIAASERKAVVRTTMLLKAVTFGCASLALSIITLPSAIWRTYWQMKLAANVGRFMAVFGQHYKSYK
jgi:succinoglycan biosynthesis protein ExoM